VVERMRQLRADGLTFAAIADRLNADGVETARGGHWHDTTVRRVLNR
jgi:Recombinase